MYTTNVRWPYVKSKSCGAPVLRLVSIATMSSAVDVLFTKVVQFLLLMGQYLQGTQRSVETWTIHGLAVKAALQLGLHSSKASKHLSPLIQEYRKRTWYGCVILDRTLSMTFGRPAAIPEDYVMTDLPCHVDLGNSPAPVMPHHEVSLGFFNATM